MININVIIIMRNIPHIAFPHWSINLVSTRIGKGTEIRDTESFALSGQVRQVMQANLAHLWVDFRVILFNLSAEPFGEGMPPAGLPDMGFWLFSVPKWKFLGDFAIGPGWSGSVTTFTLIAKVYVGCHNFWQRSWWWEQGSCKKKFVLRFLSTIVPSIFSPQWELS